jgi:hypothetical protein
MVRKVVGTCVALAVTAAAGVVGAVGTAGGDGVAARGSAADRAAGAAQRRPIRFPRSDLFIEINGTDGDAGLQMNLDGEDWAGFTLRDPTGRTVMEVQGEGRLRGYGLTGMTFESSEPPFAKVPFRKFKARFPEGRYRFTGRTVRGRRLIGSDRLTYHIPRKPAVLTPAEDAVVNPARLDVSWKPVTRPRGIRIVRYLVIVAEEATDRELSMELRPGATRVGIPAGFLEPGGEYKLEVLAREKSGNQTITEVPFTTSG